MGTSKKDILAEKLKFIREVLNLSQDDFAARIGISRRALQTYETEGRTPKASVLRNIVRIFNVSPSWLLQDEGEPFEKPKKQPGRIAESEIEYLIEEHVMIPLLNTEVAANVVGTWPTEKIVDYYPFKRVWLRKIGGSSEEKLKRFVLLRCRGDSMSPTINNGEVMLVDTNLNRRIEIEDFAIYMVRREDDTIAVKRVVQKSLDVLLCLSDNINYKPFTIKIESEKTIQDYIIGRVLWVGRELIK